MDEITPQTRTETRTISETEGNGDVERLALRFRGLGGDSTAWVGKMRRRGVGEKGRPHSFDAGTVPARSLGRRFVFGFLSATKFKICLACFRAVSIIRLQNKNKGYC
jgi:hypothetical protein